MWKKLRTNRVAIRNITMAIYGGYSWLLFWSQVTPMEYLINNAVLALLIVDSIALVDSTRLKGALFLILVHSLAIVVLSLDHTQAQYAEYLDYVWIGHVSYAITFLGYSLIDTLVWKYTHFKHGGGWQRRIKDRRCKERRTKKG